MGAGGAPLGELGDHGAHRGMEAVHVGAGIAGGRHRHDRGIAGFGVLLKFNQDARHIVADGFGQAGGGHADQLRMILPDDVAQALLQIVAAAKDGAVLGEVGGRDVHRLAEMTDQVPAHIGGAALRTVHQGHRPADAAERQAGAERRAELAGVLRRGVDRLLLAAEARLQRRRAGGHNGDHGVPPRRAGAKRHTGLMQVACTSRAKFNMPTKPANATLRSWLWSQKPTPSL